MSDNAKKAQFQGARRKDNVLIQEEREDQGDITPTPDDVAEAIRILESDHPLTEAKPYLDMLVAGEDANKQLVFQLLLSGKCRDPKKKQIILLLGDAGGGKTTIANNLSRLFKTKKIGRFSKRALDYTELTGYEVLYLQEMGKMDDEEYGISTLKFLSADDKGYTIEITTYDNETKSWTTFEKKIPPVTVISCSTRVEFDPQFTRRAWPLNIDESIEQTGRIEAFKIQEKWEDNFLALGIMREPKKSRALRVLKAIVEQLEDVNVFIPFPGEIFSILKKEKIRVRGDYDKFWALAWFHTFLMQKVLPKVNGIIVASPAAIAELFTLAQSPLVIMTTGLQPRFLKLFDAMKDLGITLMDSVITLETRGRLARNAGLSESTITMYLRELAKQGYFVTRPAEKGRSLDYMLPDNLASIIQKRNSVLEILENSGQLALKFAEGAENHLTTLLETNAVSGVSLQNIEEYIPLLQEITSYISGEKQRLLDEIEASQPELSESSSIASTEPEKKPKTVDIQESGRIVQNIESQHVAYYTRIPGDVECEVCGRGRVAAFRVDIDGSVLLRCGECFQGLRTTFPNIRFQPKEESEE